MGSYLNIGSGEFQECVASEIYVDKSMIIQMCNACLYWNYAEIYLCKQTQKIWEIYDFENACSLLWKR